MNVIPGTTDKSVYIYLQDAVTGGPYTTESGYDSFYLDYIRDGAAADTNQANAAALASATAAHADNKVFHCGNGLWRLDYEDGAFAAGVNHVLLQVRHSSNGFLAASRVVDLGVWATATGFATPTNVTDARDHIETHGDSGWITAAGFATPTNVTDARDSIKGADGDDLKAISDELDAAKGATFDGGTDSLEAIRNRGDSEWITAAGFATPTDVTALGDLDIDSTGTPMTLKKAIEAIVAAVLGKAAHDAANRQVSFKGRDGSTEIVEITYGGEGVRTAVTVN